MKQFTSPLGKGQSVGGQVTDYWICLHCLISVTSLCDNVSGTHFIAVDLRSGLRYFPEQFRLSDLQHQTAHKASKMLYTLLDRPPQRITPGLIYEVFIALDTGAISLLTGLGRDGNYERRWYDKLFLITSFIVTLPPVIGLGTPPLLLLFVLRGAHQLIKLVISGRRFTTFKEEGADQIKRHIGRFLRRCFKDFANAWSVRNHPPGVYGWDAEILARPSNFVLYLLLACLIAWPLMALKYVVLSVRYCWRKVFLAASTGTSRGTKVTIVTMAVIGQKHAKY